MASAASTARRNTGSTVVLAGALAQRPGVGGHTWVFLQWLLGLRALGHDVLFVDWLTPEMCGGSPVAESAQLRYAREVFDRFGFGDALAVVDRSTGATVAGPPRSELRERIARSDALLNVMGYLDDEELLGAAPLRAFVDIDPGFGQMWRALDLADVFAGHDAFVTIGERIGEPDCAVPTCGLDWIPTPPPVMVDAWDGAGPGRRDAAITSVGSWRGGYGPIDYEGTRYGLRVHELRRFATLPRHVEDTLELALKIDPSEEDDLRLLREGGWRLVDPAEVAGDPWRYRDYVRASKAEIMIAKHMYVASRSGWISDRSLCYLASGRPVVAQDTGVSLLYPADAGLLTFTTLDEAADAIALVDADYERHAAAALALAREHFDAPRVVGRVLDRLGVS